MRLYNIIVKDQHYLKFLLLVGHCSLWLYIVDHAHYRVTVMVWSTLCVHCCSCVVRTLMSPRPSRISAVTQLTSQSIRTTLKFRASSTSYSPSLVALGAWAEVAPRLGTILSGVVPVQEAATAALAHPRSVAALSRNSQILTRLRGLV